MKLQLILFICFFQLLLTDYSFGQIPLPTEDFAQWEWEDQNATNWKMSDGSRSYSSGNVDPPFPKLGRGAGDPRIGLIKGVAESRDYTKNKGWSFLSARFGKNVPYGFFILYNKYRAIIRLFYYVGKEQPSASYAIAKCLFRDPKPGKANPAILSSAVPYMYAPDKYLNKTHPGNDILVQVIPDGVVPGQWNAVDFSIMLDPNYRELIYEGATMEIRVYGVTEGALDIEGTGASASNPKILEQVKKDGFFYRSEGDINSPLKLTEGKLATIKKTAAFASSISESLEKINSTASKFLKEFKQYMQLAKVPGFLNTVSTITSAVGGYLSAANFLIGVFGGESTDPVINFQVFEFKGTIKTSDVIITTSLKLPGVLVSPNQEGLPVYDSTIGIINLKTSPIIQITKPYRRLEGGIILPFSGYKGKYVKYRLNRNIEIAVAQIPGMQLKDIKLAILCKPQKDNKQRDYYSPTDKYIYNYFSSPTVLTRVPNPVYQDLEKGRFVIHKYNPDESPAKQEIIFGTPYREKKCFKNITFEVPEKTDVYLGVYAIFKVDGFKEPVVFHAKYLFDKETVEFDKGALNMTEEQPKFPYIDYYNHLPFAYILDQPNTSGVYTTESIQMKPGFSAPSNGFFKFPFIAKAEPATKCEGNNDVEPVPYEGNPASAKRIKDVVKSEMKKSNKANNKK